MYVCVHKMEYLVLNFYFLFFSISAAIFINIIPIIIIITNNIKGSQENLATSWKFLPLSPNSNTGDADNVL